MGKALAITLYSICVVTLLPSCTSPHSILLLSNSMGSHISYITKFGMALTSRGHNVTFVTARGARIPSEVKESDLEVMTYKIPDIPFSDQSKFKEMTFENAFSSSILTKFQSARGMFQMMSNEAEAAARDAGLMEALRKKKFDFTIVDGVMMAFFIIPYTLRVPYATIINDCNFWIYRIPALPSFVPQWALSYNGNMSFTQRFINSLTALMLGSISSLTLWSDPKDSSLFTDPTLPNKSYLELLEESKMCFCLRDMAMDVVRPYMPNIIPIASIMGRPAQPLPDDLELFLSNAQHGVVIVSFGSWLEGIPSQTLNKLFLAFSKLDQKFVWKLKEPGERDIPGNVKLMSWMPQNDLLGHPNVKVLVSHGGINSLTEAVYHGVPVVMFPIAGDQGGNAAIFQERGYGEVINIKHFEIEELVITIQDVVSNPKYAESIQEASKFLRSQPAADQRVEFWVDHVIRHGDRFLRGSAHHLSWYQYLLLDVILCLILLITLTATLLYKITSYLCCQRCKRKTTKKKTD